MNEKKKTMKKKTTTKMKTKRKKTKKQMNDVGSRLTSCTSQSTYTSAAEQQNVKTGHHHFTLYVTAAVMI